MEMKDTPLMHLFTHQGYCYVYDTNQNRLMKVSPNVFVELHNLYNIGIQAYHAYETISDNSSSAKRTVQHLLYKGYFTPSNTQKIELPNREYIYDLLNQSLSMLILQATRDCNFDCRYCAFAGGGVYNRVHEKKKMDTATARSAIDFLLARSVNSDELYITFYGGEPFLEFDFIKECVKYVISKARSKKLHFEATINGSLINDYMIEFLEYSSFDLLISLDGPKEIQNSNRRFRHNGAGTYDAVVKNIRSLMEHHRNYFDNHVKFNAVVLNDNMLSLIEDFFLNDIGVDLQKVKIQYANLSGLDYLRDYPIDSLDLGRMEIKKTKRESYLADVIDRYSDFKDIFLRRSTLPPLWHHNGPCYPGFQRLFVNCEGEFFPCEKVSETCNCLKIGNLKDGFDMRKIESLLDIGILTQKECCNCWAKRFCDICALKCVNYESDRLEYRTKLDMCKKVESQTLQRLKDYINRKGD